jgi:hypothetical protein
MSNLLQQVAQPLQQITTFIYGLVDPRTGHVRYVGKSNKPTVRLGLHLIPSQLKETTHKTRWLRQLLDAGERPRLIILENVPKVSWPESEKKWISHYRNLPNYPPLTNSTDGGEGVEGYVYSEEERKKRSASHLGLKMPPGTGKKISEANRGIPKSTEARIHFSSGQKNRWQNASDEEKQNMLKNLRNPQSHERIEQSRVRSRNAPRISNTTSQYRNVIRVKGTKEWQRQWRAGCIIDGKHICIGFFYTEEEAARARDRYVLKHIGEHVILNFPRAEYESDPCKIVVSNGKHSRSQTISKNNASGYKGVRKNGKNGWTASISHMGTLYRLGTHRTREDAARRWDLKAIELFGDLAVTNFPRASYD